MKKKFHKDLHNPFIISKNVYLRPVEFSDASSIQKWHNDPELRKFARCGELPMTLEKEEEDIKAASHAPNEAYLMIVKKRDNKPIGFIRINDLTSSARDVWLRMIIGDKSSWGKNFAGEALRSVLEWLFYELNIHRVTLGTYATNKRALKFFEKMGFKREGILREAHFEDGTYHDIISFGLLKKEFSKK